MKQTAVEQLEEYLSISLGPDRMRLLFNEFEKAKEMEKNDTDNKVIHFAEWLTNKHTTTLITLYEQFEEQYYNETFNK